MQLKYFREFDFVNWVDFEDQSLTLMEGYYFQTWVPVENQLWKIDIWLITPEYDKSVETTEHFKKLLAETDESKKIAILEIKDAMKQGKKYIKNVDGKMIYEAVLENDISSLEGFEEFLRVSQKIVKSHGK